MKQKNKYNLGITYIVPIAILLLLFIFLFIIYPINLPETQLGPRCTFSTAPSFICTMPYSMNSKGQVSFYMNMVNPITSVKSGPYYETQFACVVLNTNTPNPPTDGYFYATSLGLKNDTLQPNNQYINITNLQCYNINGTPIYSGVTSLSSSTTYHVYIWVKHTNSTGNYTNYSKTLIGDALINPT